MKKTVLLLLLLTLFSCQKGDLIHDVNKDFPENQWQSDDIKKFEFTLEKGIKKGDINIIFSHIHKPGYDSVPIFVTIESPNGEKEDIETTLVLKDAGGNELSDCAGDVCDLQTTIKNAAKLEKGIYKVTVQNKHEYAYVANVLGVGVSVEKDR